MRRTRASYRLLNSYVGKEYFLSFLVSFAFFFFIFFVNQILVLAQKILLKNVDIFLVLQLVVLSIPQFLMYTMPFSSLASASMVIGNLSSQNEILALRSSGVHLKRIFIPIIAISILFSAGTFFIADRMIPFTAQVYRELYSKILKSIPTLELNSYSSTQFGKRVISNGVVDGNIIHDVLIYDDTDKNNRRVISADLAEINLVDINRFLYRIDLQDPKILITDQNSIDSYSLASAKDLSVYLDLSSAASGYTSVSPSQMSIGELKRAIASKEEEHRMLIEQQEEDLRSVGMELGKNLVEVDSKTVVSSDFLLSVLNSTTKFNNRKSNDAFSFYYQYYRSELQKKIVLSVACTILVFVAFPISFFKIRYGRLIGFGVSMLVACFYWFYLYFMHTRAIMTALNPAWFMWMPNITFLLAGVVLLFKLRKM